MGMDKKFTLPPSFFDSTMYKIEAFLKAAAKSYYQLNRNYPGQNYQVSQMQIVAIC